MAHVEANQLSVRFPVLNSSARSLKKQLLLRTTGGRIAADSTRVIQIQALEQVSFSCRAGDRIGLIGHNGSGKSTLLRVLAGIYHPWAGSVRTEGRVAALFDSAFGMDVDSSGYDNIILRGKYLGLSRSEIDRRVDEIADFSELGGFLDMPIRTYSAGMAARLAFAISTSVEADVLLIDEGVGAGDAAFVAKANGRFQELINKSPIVVFASHDERTMRQFCTRGLVLQSGRLMFDGTIAAAYDHYNGLVGAVLA